MVEPDRLKQFAQYLERRAPGRRTTILYVSDVRQFAAVNRKPWREISMSDIDTFVDQQRQAGLSAATVKRRVAALKVFFDFLAEETGDLHWANPVRFKRHAGKQPRQLPRDLKDDEVGRVWATIRSRRDRAWFVLLWRAGLRAGELVGLRLDDVLTAPSGDQPARLRVLGKGQKERLVLLTADAYAVLAAWLAERPASDAPMIFLNERGQPLTVSGIEWLLHQYGQQAGVTLTPHQLRHTFARQVTEAGMPITSLSKLLGHAQITTTQLYTAGADPQLAQAYQQAMAHVAPAAAPSEPPAPALASPPLDTTIAPLAPPSLPEWANWGTHLPPALRQASLDFVRSRLPHWKPQRQRHRALQVLGELRRFWDWLTACHPGSA
jgi:site-specific recombinase XerD